MRKGRKWLSIGLTAVMLLMLLAGCGSSSETASTTTADATPVTEAAAPVEATTVETQEVAADVQAIIDRGVLRVGVKNAVVGFGYQNRAFGFWRH